MQKDSDTGKDKKISDVDLLRESSVDKQSEFLDMYDKVAVFTKELMDRNSQLQKQVNELAKKRAGIKKGISGQSHKDLEQQLERLHLEKKELMDQYRQVEVENKDFLDRYLEIESENNNLANLYVASYQLHSTLDFNEVMDIITEIIINLIGAQTFSILLLNEKHGVLQPVKVENIDADDIPDFPIGHDIIGSIAEAGEVYYREQDDPDAPVDIDNPLVCVPLKIKEQVIGIIVVYSLLPQKERLLKVDYELFTLLAAHAATAIFGSRLYSDSVRKRDTIKGFLDLLTH